MTSIDEFSVRLGNLRSEFEAKKKALAVEGRSIIHAQLKNAFDADPDLAVISWRQYTPYFNDGDACVFSFHGCSIAWFKDNVAPEERTVDIGELEEGKYIYKEYVWGEFPSLISDPDGLPEKCRASYAATKKLEAFMEANEDLAQDIFGDHVEVFAMRDGIEVEDYSHD
jgi:hypothetical protein